MRKGVEAVRRTPRERGPLTMRQPAAGGLLALSLIAFCILPAEAQRENLGRFVTNGLGSYVVEKPWIGEERLIIATGSYATNREATEIQAFGKQLRLDLLNVHRDPFSTNQTNWTLGQKLELTDRG